MLLLPRLPRCVPDAQNPHAIVEDAIENSIWISDEGRDVHARPLDYSRSTVGMLLYLRDGLSDPYFDRCGDHLSKGPPVCGNLLEIDSGALRVFHFHATRNALSAASTSSSVATPLRSPSSIASSSSGVAR